MRNRNRSREGHYFRFGFPKLNHTIKLKQTGHYAAVFNAQSFSRLGEYYCEK